ncbi:glycoside hydrolase family 71 protein [Serendipita vermifera MAFF 305830]|uniref:Glycoside hydrolase family 71 protein n=1 Tax=Serendipita vermifera MAFF 305830 TaxID=933852 RepID=A0A0C3AUA3_SERVB|nr:glycoside hydrolase family 71 protein [Serendipita vermifera MAFF 305830]
MKGTFTYATGLSLLLPALASHDIYRRSRAPHNRLDIPLQKRTIHEKPPLYPLNTLGTSHPSKRADPSLPEGWVAGGCIYDSEQRVMKEYAVKSAENTPAHCIATCSAHGFSYAGVEFSDECWCSNGFDGRGTIQAKSDECNMPCAGDPSLACGGGYRMLWFSKDPLALEHASSTSSNSITSPPDGWTYADCIRDRPEPNRVLPALFFQSATMTPAQCMDGCRDHGYDLAGVEYGTQCWCANDFNTSDGPVEKVDHDEADCGKPCPGDHTQRCGDEWVMQVYRFDSSTKALLPRADPAWVEGPCMVDQQSQRLLSNQQSLSSPFMTQNCLDACASRGFDIAGVYAGSDCWCGNNLNLNENEQPWKREVERDECSSACEGGDSQETCGQAGRTLLFSRNGALDSCSFGFTRKGSLDNAATFPLLALGQPEPDQGSLPSIHVVVPDPLNLNQQANTESIVDKMVIAHHMVGNTYPYTLQTWISDIKLAKSAGIDAFALNFGEGGQGSWQKARMADAFTAAQMVGGFGMIFSFDMTVLPCGSQDDASVIRNYIMTYGPTLGHLAISPASGSALRRIVVSTFAGEYCTFGTGSVRDGWLSIVKNPEVVSRLEAAGREIAFIPSWFARIEGRRGEFNGVVQGDFHWNGGWPAGNNDINWDTDAYHLQYNPGPLYMASVSPWFFTHYGANSFNKNWIYRGDDWLYASRWELLMEHRAAVDLVEIVTWNDYGESSYIGPIEGDQPNSQAWVNGYPHLGFLEMTSYYAQAYKTEAYPTISEDKVYIWSRPHPKYANAPADPVGRPNNADWTDDYVWALVMSSGKGQFTLRSGANSETFPLKAGVNKFKVSNSPGSIRGTIRRLGVDVVDVNPGSQFTYTLDPPSYNFNVFVANN